MQNMFICCVDVWQLELHTESLTDGLIRLGHFTAHLRQIVGFRPPPVTFAPTVGAKLKAVGFGFAPVKLEQKSMSNDILC